MTVEFKGEKIMKRTLFALLCVLTITGICLVTRNYVASTDGTVETVTEENVTDSPEGLVL